VCAHGVNLIEEALLDFLRRMREKSCLGGQKCPTKQFHVASPVMGHLSSFGGKVLVVLSHVMRRVVPPVVCNAAWIPVISRVVSVVLSCRLQR